MIGRGKIGWSTTAVFSIIVLIFSSTMVAGLSSITFTPSSLSAIKEAVAQEQEVEREEETSEAEQGEEGLTEAQEEGELVDAAVEEQEEEENPRSQTVQPSLSSEEGDVGEALADDGTNPTTTATITTTTDSGTTTSDPITTATDPSTDTSTSDDPTMTNPDQATECDPTVKSCPEPEPLLPLCDPTIETCELETEPRERYYQCAFIYSDVECIWLQCDVYGYVNAAKFWVQVYCTDEGGQCYHNYDFIPIQDSRCPPPYSPPGSEPQGDFLIACTGVGDELRIPRGGSKDFACSVASQDEFNSQVNLSCEPPQNQPSITCKVNPASVTPQPNGEALFTMTVSTTKDTPLGGHTINAIGTSGSLVRWDSVTIDCVICFTPRTSNGQYSDALFEFLKSEEGYAGKLTKTCGPGVIKSCKVTGDKFGLYNDAVDPSRGGPHCTRGYGDKIDDGPCTQKDIDAYYAEFPNGMQEQDAVKQLRKDIRDHEVYVNRYVAVELNQYQHDALVSFTFNGGPGQLKRLLNEVINNGKCDPDLILKTFTSSKYTNGGMPGLINRKTNEANMFNNGVYP